MFSIIIPTYNNLKYLELCLKSIKKNSKYNHEIIIHINEGIDGTKSYLEDKDYKTTYTSNNEGVCVAFNKAVEKATSQYIVLAHDDMYFCPKWDEFFLKELKLIPENSDFFLSGTMVQPFESYINLDCGKNIEEFNEEKLLRNLPNIEFEDFQGTHWQPSLIPTKTWNKVGGFSEELRELMFSTGIEYWYDKQFALRAGYYWEHPTKGNRQFFTVGLGIKYSIFGLDFSYLVLTSNQRNPLDNTLRFTLLFDFGAFGADNGNI